MLDAAAHKRLVRVVDVVLLRLKVGDSFWIEVSEVYADGRSRSGLNRLPGTKKEPHENTKKTAERIMKDMIGIDASDAKIDYQARENFEEEEESISYPGVW